MVRTTYSKLILKLITFKNIGFSVLLKEETRGGYIYKPYERENKNN
jgi:hypothetical protein